MPAPGFPAFYACYLLRSLRAQAIYIGSTPSPPRRIRQHNGELTQGARKTAKGRPWVMQMIVHGFPSKVAALQFEWAWQHPDRSRYLRDASGNKLFLRNTRLMAKTVEVVQAMIRMPPFAVWPLHVKLFTEDARNIWHAVLDKKSVVKGRARAPPLLPVPHHAHFPPGFTWTTELEGVDGRSGHPLGSGRTGPLDVNDEHFTSAVLAKNTALMVSGTGSPCSVCNQEVSHYAQDALSTALCPHDACMALSHMICLSTRFLTTSSSVSEGTSATKLLTPSRLVPRGGDCPSCGKYTLWGDIVRGGYRRVIGTAVVLPDEDEEATKDLIIEDEGGGAITDSDPEKDLFTSGSDDGVDPTPKPPVKGKRRATQMDPSPTKAKAKSCDNKYSSRSGGSGSDSRSGTSRTITKGKRTSKKPKGKTWSREHSSSGDETNPSLSSNSSTVTNPCSPSSHRGISSMASPTKPRFRVLVDLDDSGSDDGEYDPSIFSALGSQARITPQKGTTPEIWDISSSEEEEAEDSMGHLASNFGGLSVSPLPSAGSFPMQIIHPESAVVRLLDGLPATISPGRRRKVSISQH